MLGRRVGRGPARDPSDLLGPSLLDLERSLFRFCLFSELMVEDGFFAREKAADRGKPHLSAAGWDCLWLHQHSPVAWTGSPQDSGCQGAFTQGQRRGHLHLRHPAGTTRGQRGRADVPCTLSRSNGPANTTNTSNTRALGTPPSLDGRRGALHPWLFNPKLTSGWKSSCHPWYLSGGRHPRGWLWPCLCFSCWCGSTRCPWPCPAMPSVPPSWQGLPLQGGCWPAGCLCQAVYGHSCPAEAQPVVPRAS